MTARWKILRTGAAPWSRARCEALVWIVCAPMVGACWIGAVMSALAA